MYFVDREKIEDTLSYLEQQISLFEEVKEWTSPIEKAALERIAQIMIESILDIGNTMIDGFIMRDPGSYDDIVDILDDEKVISKEMSESFKQFITYRKMLVQNYTDVNHEGLKAAISSHIPMIKEFPGRVREYLINELGPVSAFKPQYGSEKSDLFLYDTLVLNKEKVGECHAYWRKLHKRYDSEVNQNSGETIHTGNGPEVRKGY